MNNHLASEPPFASTASSSGKAVAPADGGPIIDFRSVSYTVSGGQTLLKNLNLRVQRGETLVLLGRSGAGKTTAMKLINRLHDPSEGQVRVEGRPTSDWDAIALRRHTGYVIQETGLFPHYTVEQNIALVPQLERWPAERIAARVQELMALVGLDAGKFLARYPHQLSGGQRQRIGLARALAADPPILLMDEPFGALDPLTRSDIRREFLALEQRLKKTVVLVTHDIGEALALGDRIALMEDGELRGNYAPEEFLRATDPLAAAYAAQLELPKRRGVENAEQAR